MFILKRISRKSNLRKSNLEMNSVDLPKISLQKLKQKDVEELARLKSCMIELGFFKLAGHGLDPKLRKDFKIYASWAWIGTTPRDFRILEDDRTNIIIKIFRRENFEKTSKLFFDLPAEAKYKVRRELSKNVFRGYYGTAFLYLTTVYLEPLPLKFGNGLKTSKIRVLTGPAEIISYYIISSLCLGISRTSGSRRLI